MASMIDNNDNTRVFSDDDLRVMDHAADMIGFGALLPIFGDAFDNADDNDDTNGDENV